MKSTGLILQFFAALSVAASLAWLGETWKQEGKIFIEAQEKLGGNEKTRLIGDGNTRKTEIVERAEAEAREVKGLIDGAARAKADVIVNDAMKDRTLLKEQSTLAQAYAMEAMTGLDHLADRFAGLAREGRGDTAAYQTIERYIRRAYGAYQELRALSWGPDFNCSVAHEAAARIASNLAYGSGGRTGGYSRTQAANPFAELLEEKQKKNSGQLFKKRY